MIRVINIEPPEVRPHIVRIVELDFDNVFSGTFAANANLGILMIDDDDDHAARVWVQLPLTGERLSLSEHYRHIVYFSDGKVARAANNQIDHALDILNQAPPETCWDP